MLAFYAFISTNKRTKTALESTGMESVYLMSYDWAYKNLILSLYFWFFISLMIYLDCTYSLVIAQPAKGGRVGASIR